MNHSAAHTFDRQGLIHLTSRYLAALVANDPSAVPLADDVRTVENLRQVKPGEGLWVTASGGPAAFAIHVPDPQRQTAGFLGMIEQGGGPVLLGLRLTTRDGQIVEAEHLCASGLAEANLPNLQVPRPGLLAEIPPGQRLPADDLRAIGATYYDALADNDSSLSPIAADCERHENGLITAGPTRGAPPPTSSSFPTAPAGCAAQIDSKVFTYIAAIDNRRVFAADTVTGLAMGLSMFRHPMDNIPYEVILVDGTSAMFAPGFAPFDLPAAHIFKIGPDRQIHEIEAMGFRAPHGSPAGW
jgi:hypothetical protein